MLVHLNKYKDVTYSVCPYTALPRSGPRARDDARGRGRAHAVYSHNLPRATGARRVVSTAERHSGRAMHHGSRALTRPATGIASAWHPHALVRAAFDDFDLDRRGLRGRSG